MKNQTTRIILLLFLLIFIVEAYAQNLKPTNIPTIFKVKLLESDSLVLFFNKGNGMKRFITCSDRIDTASMTLDSIIYKENPHYGKGDTIRKNQYVVYSDTGTSFTFYGHYNTEYYFRIYEMNLGKSKPAYSASYLDFSQMTLPSADILGSDTGWAFCNCDYMDSSDFYYINLKDSFQLNVKINWRFGNKIIDSIKFLKLFWAKMCSGSYSVEVSNQAGSKTHYFYLKDDKPVMNVNYYNWDDCVGGYTDAEIIKPRANDGYYWEQEECDGGGYNSYPGGVKTHFGGYGTFAVTAYTPRGCVYYHFSSNSLQERVQPNIVDGPELRGNKVFYNIEEGYDDCGTWQYDLYWTKNGVQLQYISDNYSDSFLLNYTGLGRYCIGFDVDGCLSECESVSITDLSIKGMNMPLKGLCPDSLSVKYIIKNNGTDTLKSVIVRWQIDGKFQNQDTIQKTIKPSDSSIFQLNKVYFNSGKHTVKIWLVPNTNISYSGPYNLIDIKHANDTTLLTFTVGKIKDSIVKVSSCDSFIYNNFTYFKSGTYDHKFKNITGCDSTVHLNLTIHFSSDSTLITTSCDSFIYNKVIYFKSGVYDHKFVNNSNCDSTIHLNLTINNSTTFSFNKSMCMGDSILFGGKYLMSQGSYKTTLKNSTGCDSIITLNLTINKQTSSTLSVTACDNYVFAGKTLTASGTYFDTLPNNKGCDSFITLNLTINTVNNSVSLSGKTLSATETGATYQWLDCNNGNAKISGATNQTYTPTVTGDYAVALSKNTCLDTSACTNVVITGVEFKVSSLEFKVYPNPTSGILNIELSSPSKENIEVKVYDIVGQLCHAELVEAPTKTNAIDLSGKAKGIYLIECISKEGVMRERVVVE